MSYMTAREFIETIYQDNTWSNGPQPITLDDTRYNLRELKADGVPIPATVTPMLYFRYWNLLYMQDMHKIGGATA